MGGEGVYFKSIFVKSGKLLKYKRFLFFQEQSNVHDTVLINAISSINTLVM